MRRQQGDVPCMQKKNEKTKQKPKKNQKNKSPAIGIYQLLISAGVCRQTTNAAAVVKQSTVAGFKPGEKQRVK
jgi:hypothetical protein